MGKKKYKGRRAEAFIFDLDGTLVDSGLDIALAANFTRGHFKLPELPVETIQGYVGDGVVRLLTRALGHDVLTGQTGDAGLPVDEQMRPVDPRALRQRRRLRRFARRRQSGPVGDLL